jgi:hypothetical protein
VIYIVMVLVVNFLMVFGLVEGYCIGLVLSKTTYVFVT